MKVLILVEVVVVELEILNCAELIKKYQQTRLFACSKYLFDQESEFAAGAQLQYRAEIGT